MSASFERNSSQSQTSVEIFFLLEIFDVFSFAAFSQDLRGEFIGNLNFERETLSELYLSGKKKNRFGRLVQVRKVYVQLGFSDLVLTEHESLRTCSCSHCSPIVATNELLPELRRPALFGGSPIISILD